MADAVRRVLYLDHHDRIIGGGQLSLIGLMRHLEHWLPLCACPPGELAAAVRNAGVAVAEMELPPLRMRMAVSVMGAVLRICRLVRRGGIALLHANSSRAMFYAGLAGQVAGVPVVWHVRIAEEDGSWDRLLAGLAARIAVNSQATRERFARVRSAEKVRLIYNGEELEPYALASGAQVRRELGVEEGYLVGMVGRLTPEKDHETFLRAAALVVARWPQARFLIAGEDPDPHQQRRRALEALAAESGLSGKVIFTGPRQDIPQVMAALDALVHCAHIEAFGRVLVEAMAAGKPVVATRVGGIPEVVEHGRTGVLVNEGDEVALAGEVEALMGDPAAARSLGEAGQQRARERFSIAAHVAAVEALYGELLGEEV